MHRFINQPRHRLYSTARTFAQGFEPPKGSRETPKWIPKRRNPATSLPSHMGNAESTKAPMTMSPKKQYRDQLRLTRHQYANELLGKHGKKETVVAAKQAASEKRMQQEKEALAHERQVALEREAELVQRLDLDLQKTSSIGLSQKQQQRDQHRQYHEQTLREQRRKQLVKLYSSAEHFVTLENLDAKIEQALHTKPHPAYHTSLEEYILTSTSEAAEVERRKDVIKEAMGL
ncbi:hypothetical protein BDA99DRAFT_563265 [Phascolomyces articulosus]|uniref:Uncharacterized protein n=1 Tax=Phascolomyces articulosus TaxID=60185 RepID=A0AAD5PA91_9FUNG|nr:hypothetical protein BDA99DRAFT_563265 [Phascolomyces articulosus]